MLLGWVCGVQGQCLTGKGDGDGDEAEHFSWFYSSLQKALQDYYFLQQKLLLMCISSNCHEEVFWGKSTIIPNITKQKGIIGYRLLASRHHV